jgi:hypothetical protein
MHLAEREEMTEQIEIPFSRNESDFHQTSDKNIYFCSLNPKVVDKKSTLEVITLRNFLEETLSKKLNRRMEMGFAEYALDKYNERSILCYFKEAGATHVDD